VPPPWNDRTRAKCVPPWDDEFALKKSGVGDYVCADLRPGERLRCLWIMADPYHRNRTSGGDRSANPDRSRRRLRNRQLPEADQRDGAPKDAQAQLRQSTLELTGWYMREIPESVRAAMAEMAAEICQSVEATRLQGLRNERHCILVLESCKFRCKTADEAFGIALRGFCRGIGLPSHSAEPSLSRITNGVNRAV
jgi:hypothetical protein